jgi:Fe-S-cluster-containing hydrogenase component 2
MPRFETGSSSCLVRLHSHSECRRCQEVCPADAISRNEDRTMRVDQSACIGCGLCLSVCPTGVFSVVGLDVKSLLDNIAAHVADGTVTLRCASTSPAGSTPDSALELPCIGILDEDLIMTLAAKGVRALDLRVGNCEACTLHARKLIDTTLAEVHKRWPNRLHVEIQQVPSDLDADFSAALDGLIGPAQPATYDRRDFLRGIVNRARDLASEPVSPPKAQWGSRPLPTRISARREALLAAIRDDDPVAFPLTTIGESCDGCQDAHSLCDRFCPTGALRRIDSAAGSEFVFLPEVCADCGQCAFVCPQNAIHRQEDTTSRSPLTLKTLEAGTCSQCQRVATSLAGGLCPECSRRSEVRDMLVDWAREPE